MDSWEDFFLIWRISLMVLSVLAIIGINRAVLGKQVTLPVRIFVVGVVSGILGVIWSNLLALDLGVQGTGSTAFQSFFVLGIVVSVFGFKGAPVPGVTDKESSQE